MGEFRGSKDATAAAVRLHGAGAESRCEWCQEGKWDVGQFADVCLARFGVDLAISHLPSDRLT